MKSNSITSKYWSQNNLTVEAGTFVNLVMISYHVVFIQRVPITMLCFLPLVRAYGVYIGGCFVKSSECLPYRYTKCSLPVFGEVQSYDLDFLKLFVCYLRGLLDFSCALTFNVIL